MITKQRARWYVWTLSSLAVGLVAWTNVNASAQTTATWTGAGDGENYSDPNNWDILEIPLNDGTTYNVVIPGGFTVHFDVDTTPAEPGQVTDFELAATSTFIVDPGHAYVALDDALIGGVIWADESTFLAPAAGAAFSGNRAQLHTLGGGNLAVAGTTYSSTGLNTQWSTYDILTADGAGTLLDLSSLQTINAGFNDGGSGTTVQRMEATNYATIDLQNLQTLVAPYRAEDRLEIVMDVGGNVDLSSLSTISSAGQGTTRFDLDVPNFTLPALESASYVAFELFTDSVWDFPALTDLNHATLALWPGATLNMINVLEATGGTYTLPQTGDFRAATTINAQNLIAVHGITFNLGNEAVLNAPSLTSFTSCTVGLDSGAAFTTGVLDNIDDSRIHVGEAVQFGAAFGDLNATTYSSTGLNTQWTTYDLFTAQGTLDLSTLQSINAGFNDGGSGTTRQRITAEAGGTVDLSGVDTITGPNRAEDTLQFIIHSGSTLDLSNLQTINSASVGNTTFDIDVLNFSLPALQTANHAAFDVVAGGTLGLPALLTLGNTSFDMGTGSILNIPAVTQHSGGSVTVPDTGAINAESLASLDSVTLDLGVGGTFNAPSLTSFTGCVVNLELGHTFTTGALDNIDNSRIRIGDDLQWGSGFGHVSATTYSSTGLNTQWATYDLFTAQGTLDLSTLQSINAGFNDGGSGATHQRITAEAGGVIDLSDVNSITGPYRAEDDLQIIIDTGSNIDLSTLHSITSANAGLTNFTINVPNYSLPALLDAAKTTFSAIANAVLNLPALTMLSSSTLNVPAAGSVNAVNLTTVDGSTISFGDGGTLNAPNLTSLTQSVLSLEAANTIVIGSIDNLDNTRIHVGDGVQFGSGFGHVSATSYSSTGLATQWQTFDLFVSSGGGTLDLASLDSINAGFNDGGNGASHQRIRAEAGGIIDLSGVDTIIGPNRAEDTLQIHVNSGSVIDLASLDEIDSVNLGYTKIYADGQSTLDLGNLTVTDRLEMHLADPETHVNVAGSLLLNANAVFTSQSGAHLTVGDNFSFGTTDEANFSAQAGIFQFVGDAPQFLEIGGEDTGLPSGDSVLNFGIGQLIVGDDQITTVVQLLEVIDNGNRGPAKPEALYLYGLGGPDGLHILGGSTLRLNSLNCYAVIEGEWVHLNGLFLEGEAVIPFDDGFLRRDAGSMVVGDMNCDGVLNAFDIDPFVLALTDEQGYKAAYPDCDRNLADINGDWFVNAFDIDPFVELLTGG